MDDKLDDNSNLERNFESKMNKNQTHQFHPLRTLTRKMSMSRTFVQNSF